MSTVEGVADEPAGGVAVFFELAAAEDDAAALEIEVEPGVGCGVEKRFGGRHDEGRMGGGDQLHFGLADQLLHYRDEGGDDLPLPLGVEMGFDFIDEEDDLFGGVGTEERGGLFVLFPGPNEQVGQGEDAAHASGGVEDGDVLAVGHADGGDVAGVVETEAGEFAGTEGFLWGGGEDVENGGEVFECRAFLLLPAGPIEDEAVAERFAVRTQ